MTSRREFVAGLGTAVTAGLAGCGALGGNEQGPDRLTAEDLGEWSPPQVAAPNGFPVEIPDAMAQNHRSRAEALLETVPADLTVPNEAVQSALRDDRERVAAEISSPEQIDRPLDRLRARRWTRGEAAALVGAYRAATGENDATALDERRRAVRRAGFELQNDLSYAARSPIEAVLVFAPVESLLETVRRRTRPRVEYPDQPAHDPEAAGDVFQAVERAAGAFVDARGLRETYRNERESLTDQWATLIDRSRWIEYAVDQTQDERIGGGEPPDRESAFDFELTPVERELYQHARRRVLGHGTPIRTAREAGRYGQAVVEAGKRLAAITAYDAVVDAIETDTLPDEQTTASLEGAATRAAAALRNVPLGEYPFLGAAILSPAVDTYGTGERSVNEYVDLPWAEGSFRYAALYANAAPGVATDLADRLRGERLETDG
jgi:hypothetical protein